MSENLRNFLQSAYTFDAVTRRVPSDAWDAQSPCDEWSGRAVAGHVIWGFQRLAAQVSGSAAPAEQPEADVAGADPLATWEAARDAFIVALDQEGALHREVHGPFGNTTVDGFLQIYSTDVLAHSWDLAVTAGLDPHLPTKLCEQAIPGLRAAGDALRGPGLMGPEVIVADDASPADRFVALLGRNPAGR